MPPPIPDRYRLEVRLGRDEDVEEWFATDLELDRPVLIRVIGPEATRERGRAFLAAVRRASRASHTHVAAVFAADTVPGSTYAVTEWVGGTTLADQVGADGGPPLAELLTNAGGLAEGLERRCFRTDGYRGGDGRWNGWVTTSHQEQQQCGADA